MKALTLLFILFSSQAFAIDATELKGTYDLDVKIGNHRYHDIVKILLVEPVEEAKGIYRVEGTFEAPNVFTSKAKGYFKKNLGLGEGYPTLTLEFIAKENNGTFLVKLKQIFQLQPNFGFKFSNGTLSTSDGVFGNFKATKRLK